VSNDRMKQMESICKEAAETRTEVISAHLPNVTDEKHKGITSVLVSRPRIEPGTSQIQVYNVLTLCSLQLKSVAQYTEQQSSTSN
jgi:hypothetical protein